MSVLDVDQVANFLNMSEATQLDKLQATLDAAEKYLARRVGPLAPTAVVRRASGGGTALVLNTGPVQSLTSVTSPGGGAMDTSTLDVDDDTLLVFRTGGGRFAAGTHVVTYVAGHDPLPGDIEHAVKELTRHLWRPQRGPSRNEPDVALTPGYLIPNLVKALIEDYLLPGIS